MTERARDADAGTCPDGQVPAGRRRRGRPRTTTRAEIERLAIELFLSHGFEDTTIDDIAARARIGRRTFFRYFASKNDVPWGEFDANLGRMQELLTALPQTLPVLDAVRAAVLDFNRVDDAETPWLRRRMQLILTVPALQAHSMIKYAQWRQVVAEFVAQRTGETRMGLVPQAVGWAALGVSVAAYEQWLADPRADLSTLLDTAYRGLATGFAPALIEPFVDPPSGRAPGLPGRTGRGRPIRAGENHPAESGTATSDPAHTTLHEPSV